jgi:hypothetical protein
MVTRTIKHFAAVMKAAEESWFLAVGVGHDNKQGSGQKQP